MSFGSAFGSAVPDMFQDALTPTRPNPLSPLGADESSEDELLDGFNFSSILDQHVSESIKKMSSPFHTTAEPHIKTIESGQPITAKNLGLMISDLLAVAEKLLEQLQAFELDPTKTQERVERLGEFQKTLKSLFDVGTLHRKPDAISALAKLYKKMPPQKDKMISGLFFQYTKLETFSLGHQPQNTVREEVSYFHFQMMTVLKKESGGDAGPGSDQGRQKIDVLHLQLMRYSAVKESLDHVKGLPAEITARLEEAILDEDDTISIDDDESIIASNELSDDSGSHTSSDSDTK